MRKKENNLKSDIFSKELDYIKDDRIRNFAADAIEHLPDYFFEIPASSTGKYHPAYTNGEGGLARHVRAAVRIGIELSRLDWWKFTQEETDLLIAAILLHDGWKNGDPERGLRFTVTEHPLVASKNLRRLYWGKGLITDEQLQFILDGIETHMGQWQSDSRSNKKVLEKPKTKYQKFIHLADYIASRKCLEMNFDVALSN